jgi:hypothetical protein
MRKPSFGEASRGALAGAIVGGIGGLFGVGLAPALLERNLSLLLGMPMLGLLCWLISLPIGWILGGQIGPRLGKLLNWQPAEIAGGVLGGLVPVALVAFGGWYMATH